MTVTITSLASNSLGGSLSQPSFLNSHGVAVGVENSTAAIWQNDTVAMLNGLTEAASINDSGQIAGTYINSVAVTSTAVLYYNGTVTSLPSLGGAVDGEGRQ